MPFGTEIGLGSGHFVLDGGLAPPLPQRDTAPDFRPISVVTNSWIDQDDTCWVCIELGPCDMLDGD